MCPGFEVSSARLAGPRRAGTSTTAFTPPLETAAAADASTVTSEELRPWGPQPSDATRQVVAIAVVTQLPETLAIKVGGAGGLILKLPLPRWPLTAWVLWASEMVPWGAASLI